MGYRKARLKQRRIEKINFEIKLPFELITREFNQGRFKSALMRIFDYLKKIAKNPQKILDKIRKVLILF